MLKGVQHGPECSVGSFSAVEIIDQYYLLRVDLTVKQSVWELTVFWSAKSLKVGLGINSLAKTWHGELAFLGPESVSSYTC